MGFSVSKSVCSVFTQKRGCLINDLPSFILSSAPVDPTCSMFERHIYSLVQVGNNFNNYRLTLRKYLYDGCNGSFHYVCDVLPESWQSIDFNRQLRMEMISLLLSHQLIFLGRPSLRNTQIITFNKGYKESDFCELLSVWYSPILKEVLFT